MRLLSTRRVGQLSGTSDPNTWPNRVDAQDWPLLNDTRKWGAIGFDEGANTEHEGRLYIFTGDVDPATWDHNTPLNSDLVAWTDEDKILAHGGHLPLGWNFLLPSVETGGAQGQPDWRLCANCGGLFWAGDPNFQGVCVNGRGQPQWRFCGNCGGLFWNGDQTFKGVCPKGGPHSAVGWNFVLPSHETGGGQGQDQWRFCGNCGGLFWDGDKKFKGVCPRGGDHSPAGWNFILPSVETGGGQGQDQWRFCGKCGGLFWNGDQTFKGICPDGGEHSANGWNFILPSVESGGGVHVAVGWNFILPSVETGGGQGQPEWRFCGRCGGLFWNWDQNFKGVCPQGGAHLAVGWNFILPTADAGGVQGQAEWRFCGRCAGLFWDGDSNKGVCPGAPGGGFHLQVVRGDGAYWPFQAEAPIGLTLSDETPSAAFSYGGRVYVFAGISDAFFSGQTRPGDPVYGLYLTSSDLPDRPIFRTEFLFSPRLGVCPVDGSNHNVLGYQFVLPYGSPAGQGEQSDWFACFKCGCLFKSAHTPAPLGSKPTLQGGHCPAGGVHQAADPRLGPPVNLKLPFGTAEDGLNQANWRRCKSCEGLFWNGDPSGNKGFCPATSKPHELADSINFSLPHDQPEDSNNQAKWRRCRKCEAMFWYGTTDTDRASHMLSSCPVGGGHDPQGKDLPLIALPDEYVLRHDEQPDDLSQPNWALCSKCGSLFFDGDLNFKGVCPKDGGGHSHDQFNFLLPHTSPADPWHEAGWNYCGTCAELFRGNNLAVGRCPAGGSHQPLGLQFVVPHRLREDSHNQRNWRFCTKCFGLVFTGQENKFWGVAPVVVRNADHPGLPASEDEFGLVILGFGWGDLYLAWMPLGAGDPQLQSTLYYTGNGDPPWDRNVDFAVSVAKAPNVYTSLSATWLPGPRQWVVLYSYASDAGNLDDFKRPVVLRTAANPWTWSEELQIFPVPGGENPWGLYMHEPGVDRINPNLPPAELPGLDNPGWAYGAYVLNRFTEWNPSTRELVMYYLLSLSSPYQVQLMCSKIALD